MSTLKDALGRPIPDEGPLRVWLDDDLEDRRAPEGWIHLISAREAAWVLLTGRVLELSLDHDLSTAGEAEIFGKGTQVVDFLDHMHGTGVLADWPRDGISLHSGNAGGRGAMARALRTMGRRHGVEVIEELHGGQPTFWFRARE